MRTIRAVVAAIALVLLVGGPWSLGLTVEAASRSSRSTKSSSSKKRVHVRSYTRTDGTRVKAHTRSAPGARSTIPRSTRSTGTPRSTTSATVKATPTVRSPKVSGGRTATGRIARSEEAKRQFMRQTGFPNGRPGYVVDHIKPLACGGADAPSNMQWQTVSEAKAKDKTERIGCR